MRLAWPFIFNFFTWTRIARLINLLTLFLVLYFLVGKAGSIWLEQAISPDISIDPTRQSQQRKLEQGRKSLQEFQVIVERNLFGGPAKEALQKEKEKEKEKKEEELQIAKMPKAENLGLQLLGTIVSKSDSLKSRAIIAGRGKKEQSLYLEGDSLNKGVRIKRILRNKVVVNNGKRDEVLLMEMDKRAGSFVQDEEIEKRSLQESESKRISLSRDFVQNSMDNMVNLMKEVRIVPYDDGQGNKGFQLRKVQQKGIFSKLGLQNRDVLLGVNGQDLESPDKVLKLYTDLKEKSRVNLRVKRGDSIEEIQYNIF